MRQIGQHGLDLIAHFEGTILTVYADPIGLPTVGTGHLVRDRDGLKLGDTITTEQAREFLRNDLGAAETAVNRRCPNLTQNQFDACVSLAFNIGAGAFQGSTLARLLDAGDIGGAADQFERWTRAGNAHPRGLKVRRATERDLFLTPDDRPLPDGWLTAHAEEFTPNS